MSLRPADIVEWAVTRWQSEVANRPIVNIHRRTLDGTWRQVIRHFGGDPDALVGPSHDKLIDTTPPAPTASVGAVREALEEHKREWVRQIVNEIADTDTANKIVKLAELNGLFDPIKAALTAANQSDGGVEGHARSTERNSTDLPVKEKTKDQGEHKGPSAVAGIKPGPSDTPPAPQAVEAVSVEEVAIKAAVLPIILQGFRDRLSGNEVTAQVVRALLAKFKMEGRQG
jgi:hypothetical protein